MMLDLVPPITFKSIIFVHIWFIVVILVSLILAFEAAEKKSRKSINQSNIRKWQFLKVIECNDFMSTICKLDWIIISLNKLNNWKLRIVFFEDGISNDNKDGPLVLGAREPTVGLNKLNLEWNFFVSTMRTRVIFKSNRFGENPWTVLEKRCKCQPGTVENFWTYGWC